VRRYYEIQESDVGSRILEAFGKRWYVKDVMGHILPDDVGKRVYMKVTGRVNPGWWAGPGAIIQVENDQQRDARLGKGECV
jgi:hypothetical protein